MRRPFLFGRNGRIYGAAGKEICSGHKEYLSLLSCPCSAVVHGRLFRDLFRRGEGSLGRGGYQHPHGRVHPRRVPRQMIRDQALLHLRRRSPLDLYLPPLLAFSIPMVLRRVGLAAHRPYRPATSLHHARLR